MARRKSSGEGGSPPATGTPGGGEGPRPTQRFVISHLQSVHPTEQERADAQDLFSTRLQRVLPHVDVRSDTVGGLESAAPSPAPAGRRVLVVDADPADLPRLAAELTRDTVVEPELPRVPAVAYPPALTPTVRPWAAAASAVPGLEAAEAAPAAAGPGTGSVLNLTVTDAQGGGVGGCQVTVSFVGARGSINAGGVSGRDGGVSIPYDPNLWRPSTAVLEPSGRFWSQVTQQPQNGMTIRLTELPPGPVGWWQLLSGATGYDARAGEGVRVGVIDTGVGPNAALDHAVPVGAFIDGVFTAGPEAGLDAQTHGTHVSGIIGARPVDSTGFGGIAPGAELFVARVFDPTGNANQGDIASAIAALSTTYNVDLINMSLVGDASAIERDEVILALERGTLCICAAGNQGGAVGFPAAYPECVAVSGLGLVNTSPADSMAASFVPTQPGRFGVGGTFLASFSNLGPQLLCAAGGNGIISTIPARNGERAPYTDMCGTSMSSPLAAGVLAAMLGRDPVWKQIPRGAQRSAYARWALARHAVPVLSSPLLEGRGLARV